MSEVHCPTCKKRFESEHSPAMPFCSERCRLVDLGRWLDEKNSLPAPPREDAEDLQEPPAGDGVGRGRDDAGGKGSLVGSTARERTSSKRVSAKTRKEE